MQSTMVDRFFSIKNYDDPQEILEWLDDEAMRLPNGIPIDDKIIMSLFTLSDLYFDRVPEVTHDQVVMSYGDIPEVVQALYVFRDIKHTIISTMRWDDVTLKDPNYISFSNNIIDIIRNYHNDGWTITLCKANMRTSEGLYQSVLGPQEDPLNYRTFISFYTTELYRLYLTEGEETALQLFFTKQDETQLALIVAGCIWNESEDGLGQEIVVGPFIIKGEDTPQLKYLVPKDSGLATMVCSDRSFVYE